MLLTYTNTHIFPSPAARPCCAPCTQQQSPAVWRRPQTHCVFCLGECAGSQASPRPIQDDCCKQGVFVVLFTPVARSSANILIVFACRPTRRHSLLPQPPVHLLARQVCLLREFISSPFSICLSCRRKFEDTPRKQGQEEG